MLPTSYCPPNVTFSVIWYNRAFSPCFIDTTSSLVLACLMLLLGNAELFMYKKHGSKLDPNWLKPVPKLYLLQLACHLLLLCLPFLWTGLKFWINNAVYGYVIVYVVLVIYSWSMVLYLLVLERNYDLPAAPGAGHSVLLNCYWAFALAIDSLCFVNFNGNQWYFVVHSYKDRILLSVFIVRWLLTFTTFVLGMLAPGMVSIERRGQFTYRELSNSSSPKYGSTSTVESTVTAVPALADKMSKELTKSIDHLRDQLTNSESLLSQFRAMPRKSAYRSIEVAQKRENSVKNRYQNVLPYDHNRVKLKTKPEDYINASWITVKLTKQAPIRYIATQGPMPNTLADFWLMIWQQRVSVIVMLTELIESGLQKCCKYWPEGEDNDAQETDGFLVSCINVNQTARCVTREFSLIHIESQAEQTVVQVQFKEWPDHGVPRKPQNFLDFLDAIRTVTADMEDHTRQQQQHDSGSGSYRFGDSQKSTTSTNSSQPPILLHCSAGIGRTGVYIMVDAMCRCVDAGIPVKPLELVQTLRDQRMGMVQTEQQLIFACESVLKYYETKKLRC